MNKTLIALALLAALSACGGGDVEDERGERPRPCADRPEVCK